MGPTSSDRIANLERWRDEHEAVFREALMPRLDKLERDLSRIEDKVDEIDRVVIALQTRIAMLTAGAGIIGALVGNLFWKIVTSHSGG